MKLEERQEKLQEQVQKLREEREHLMDLLKIHSQVCPKMARMGSWRHKLRWPMRHLYKLSSKKLVTKTSIQSCAHATFLTFILRLSDRQVNF